MTPKKAAGCDASESPIGLTDGELRFIKAIFDNLTQKPNANWDRVAGDLGLKDAKCAKERFRQMSVRHGWRDAVTSPRKARATPGPVGDAKVKKTRSPRIKASPAKKHSEIRHFKSEADANNDPDGSVNKDPGSSSNNEA